MKRAPRVRLTTIGTKEVCLWVGIEPQRILENFFFLRHSMRPINSVGRNDRLVLVVIGIT